jgi:DNA mismatch repair protein MutS
MGDSTENPSPKPAPVEATAVTSIPTLTPMLAQYQSIKAQYPDAILFYRMGDFYEMFFDDALKAAPILEVQLTCRDKNAANPIPMCGIPHHSAQSYLQKMLDAGFKVALCEQVEDPATAKGLVRREVVRVVTPSLVGDPDLVAEDQRPLLIAVHRNADTWQVASLDLMDSELRSGTFSNEKSLLEWLAENRASEWLIADANNEKLVTGLNSQPVGSITLRPKYFLQTSANSALHAVGEYLKETQKLDSLPLLQNPLPLNRSGTLTLDTTTVRSLDVIPASRDTATGHSLLEIIDDCTTAMGRRHLKQTLLYPSTDARHIQERLDGVEEFFESPQLLDEIVLRLKGIRDLERLVSKVSLGLAMPRDLAAIRHVQTCIPEFQVRLLRARSPLLKSIAQSLDPLAELTEELTRALQEPSPATLRDGGIFLPTYHSEIGALRALATDAKSQIAAMESAERERTGISSLKIKYSRVFGYTIEVSKSQVSRVPQEYIRKQTIANGERYITVALKEFEEKAITAEQRLKSLEEHLFLQLRAKVSDASLQLIKNARLLAELDLLACFASTSRKRGYAKPKFHSEKRLHIEDARHPVVESVLPAGKFVPNTIEFSDSAGWTWILTGPNMGGKSTIMRQVALICILAQSGCFVPAASADLPILDAIFTRIGSHDDLAQGRSTFMVEMAEISRILERASEDSLILIDEIGRGTSTYDGLSLAWSLLEYTHTQIRAKTFFATHFHEITSLENRLAGCANYHVQVQKWEDSVVFLYRLGRGTCHRSYGIDVAKLAGVPEAVIARARDIQGVLESQSHRGNKIRNRAMEIHENQLDFFGDP